MKNKILVVLIIPEIDVKYDLFLPINKKIGNVITKIVKCIYELSGGKYILKNEMVLYNRITGKSYTPNVLIRETDIRNGTVLILI